MGSKSLQFTVIPCVIFCSDERPSSASSAIRSLLGKKSSLPPPTVKKPHQVGSSNLISTQLTKRNAAVEQWLMRDNVDGAGPSRPVHKASPQGLIEFDSVERSAMLTHPTANRVKAPRRRLPSILHNKDAVSVENFDIRIEHFTSSY